MSTLAAYIFYTMHIAMVLSAHNYTVPRMIGLLVPKTTKVCTGGYTQALVLRHVILMVRVVFQGL